MPEPCSYDNEQDFVSACIEERQNENSSEDPKQSAAVCYSMWRDRDCNKAFRFKSGSQSKNNPMDFIMSTDSVDRMGDIVVQDWDLSEFKKNPIALFSHDAEYPIGTWENVRVSKGKLIGRLKFAAKGTSKLIDTLRSLVEQKILRSISVGFTSGKAKPIKDSNGFRLSDNVLLEASLVSIGANAEALAITRNLPASIRRKIFGETAEDSTEGKSRKSRASGKSQKPFKVEKPMNLSEKIEALESDLVVDQARMKELEAKVGAEELEDEDYMEIDDLSSDIEKKERQLAALMKIEKSQAQQVQQNVRISGGRSQLTPQQKINAVLCAIYRGYVEHRNPVDVARTDYRDHSDIQLLTKAAVDPARTDVPGWSAELMQETWAALISEIYDQTVYGRTPGERLTFGMTGKINRPKNTGRGRLAGDFVAEGAPIPVKQGLYTSVDLTPKRMKVITTATGELLDRSNPSAGADMRSQLVMDTSELLDTRFLDAGARDTVRPAGLQDPTETGAGNINAASGTGTVADVIADMSGVVTRLNALNLGASGVWMMNRIRAHNLQYKQDAASGEFPFRSEVVAGTLGGYPFIMSNNVPSDVVYFIDSVSMNHATEMGPTITVSTEATLHMEDTDPKDIVYDDTGATPALPSKSMFQTESTAFRLIWGLDWRIIRTGGIQVLTGVAW